MERWNTIVSPHPGFSISVPVEFRKSIIHVGRVSAAGRIDKYCGQEGNHGAWGAAPGAVARRGRNVSRFRGRIPAPPPLFHAIEATIVDKVDPAPRRPVRPHVTASLIRREMDHAAAGRRRSDIQWSVNNSAESIKGFHDQAASPFTFKPILQPNRPDFSHLPMENPAATRQVTMCAAVADQPEGGIARA